MQLNGIDYIEFYVGNATQAAHFYRTTFGFTPVAYAALETGEREQMSVVIQQHKIRLLLTSALSPDSAIAEHVKLHGDSIKDIAFSVDDATYAFEETVKRGAKAVMNPTTFKENGGCVVKATIAAFGDTVHSFIERRAVDSSCLPNCQVIKNPLPTIVTGLTDIDHVAVCVEAGEADRWIDFYQDVLEFRQSHREDIVTDSSAMNSKVVQNSTGQVKFPIMEPAAGKRESQIQEYLRFHHGPGAQHIALLSGNIIDTVRYLRDNGIDFLCTPVTYYDMLEDRVGRIVEDHQALQELNVLVDRDEWGYLMQIFTKPLQGRPTAFFEIIQRKGARGFGSGNIKALFEAIEREQLLRGNL